MNEENKKKENRFVRRQLNRMQDFEYEYGLQDIKDYNELERKMLRQYEVGELNVSFLDYYERINGNG